MLVSKYLPKKLYGFCKSLGEGHEVFFHLGSFDPGDFILDGECAAPPPILNEVVMVEYDPIAKNPHQAPRAVRVSRVTPPTHVTGVVTSYDSLRRYGFVQGDDENTYHLHESEISNGRLPLAGNRVSFYAGVRKGKPRACHVNVKRS